MAIALPLALLSTPQQRSVVRWVAWDISPQEVTSGATWVALTEPKKSGLSSSWSAARFVPAWTQTDFTISCYGKVCMHSPPKSSQTLNNGAKLVLIVVSGKTMAAWYWTVGVLATDITVAPVASRTSIPALTSVAFTPEQQTISTRTDNSPEAAPVAAAVPVVTVPLPGAGALQLAVMQDQQSVPLAGATLTLSGGQLKHLAPNGRPLRTWPATAKVVRLPDRTVAVLLPIGLKMSTPWW